MLEDGFNFAAFIDFIVRVVKAVGYANVVLILFYFWQKRVEIRVKGLNLGDKFILIFGSVDFAFRIAHVISGRMIATRYYFVEAILLILPSALGIVLLRKFLCKKTSKNPLLVIACLLSLITVGQLASIFKPRPPKEYLKTLAAEAVELNSDLDYIYGDFPRMNFYAGLTYRGFTPDGSFIAARLNENPDLKAESIFLAINGDVIPDTYKGLLKWKMVKEAFDYKKRKITLWQGSTKSE